MRKKILFKIIISLTLILLFLVTSTVHAATYAIGAKTIIFEKFTPDGIEEEITDIYDYVNNSDGILFKTESGKIYHMNLDGTIEEITEEEAINLYNEGKLLVDYEVYCAYNDEEPEEFSQNLPELTFVEGTGDNAGSYAVKIGENIVSDYEYHANVDIINEATGNVMVGIAKNKITNEFDVWINTKTSSKLVTINESDDIVPSDDSAFLTVYTFNDEGNEQLIVFDWSGNEIISLELPSDSDVEVCKINTNNQEFLEVYIYYSNDGDKTEIYDLDGNKVLETENGEWLYAFQFGMVEYHLNDANTSRIVDIKNNTTISDAVETYYIDLYATTAKLKKTSEDYLAPGKYYFVTAEDGAVYEMTISYTILNGVNSSFDKTSEEDLTVKADGDLEKLEGIYVDNEKLDESNYKLTQGSTIVTLKNEYLKTLELGEHTLKLEYLDGEVETKFTITEEETLNEGSQGTGDEGEKTTGTEDKKDGTISPEILPDTGKLTLISILIVTLIVGITSFIKTRKYKEI